MLYLTNSFSVHMLPLLQCGEWESLRIRRINSAEARETLRGNTFKSFFGHADTAKYLESMWRMHIRCTRETVTFRKGDVMIIATVCGKRDREREQIENTEKRGRPLFRFYLVEYV